MQDILELEHLDRQRWVEEINAINRRLKEEQQAELERAASAWSSGSSW